ncbi:hypothetical protein ZHAS_00008707 [Anopheles sinensis]|uniref:Uncharacterized protein n=1 Tax=Anopheles sinensis TaxID=74873 RepID=A0A084VT58_ANOSI|nr:hypothetical protein ZHAS_00008707 [Anopheles sinensis]
MFHQRGRRTAEIEPTGSCQRQFVPLSVGVLPVAWGTRANSEKFRLLTGRYVGMTAPSNQWQDWCRREIPGQSATFPQPREVAPLAVKARSVSFASRTASFGWFSGMRVASGMNPVEDKAE